MACTSYEEGFEPTNRQKQCSVLAMGKCVFTYLSGDMCSNQKPVHRSPASPTLLTSLCTKQCKCVWTWISSPKHRLRNVVINGDIVGITEYVEVCCRRDSFEYNTKALWKSPENILIIMNCINAFANKKINTWIFLSGLTLHYITKFLNFMMAGRVLMMNDGSPSKQHWHLLGFHLL